MSLETFDVEPEEFNIRIRTWADVSVISQMWVTWIAHD